MPNRPERGEGQTRRAVQKRRYRSVMFELLTVPYQSTNPLARREADQISQRRAGIRKGGPETTKVYLSDPPAGSGAAGAWP